MADDDIQNDDLDTDTDVEDDDPEAVDYKAKYEKLKPISREWERRSKANKKELDRLTSNQPPAADAAETDKALATARREAREEALRESATERVEDAIRTALTGMDDDDVDDVLEAVNTSRFITDDFKLDRDRIASFTEKLAKKSRKTKTDDTDEPVATRGPAVPSKAAGTRKPPAAPNRGIAEFERRNAHLIKPA